MICFYMELNSGRTEDYNVVKGRMAATIIAYHLMIVAFTALRLSRGKISNLNSFICFKRRNGRWSYESQGFYGP